MSSTPSGAAMGRSESFPVPVPSMVPGCSQAPHVWGSRSPGLQLSPPLPTRTQNLLGNIYLSVLLVEGALKCGSMGGGSALLHGSLPKGMNQTLSLPSRSPLDREEFMTKDMLARAAC